ncbi:hypothetical protein [Tahibacter caeni]|uniref:hypothetical protein n=1 Tax=Tahibacter caeni TaxID=1453545 RepID=UPI002147B4AA|nr:hypothetical protein [Tahibacter caeni]
MRQAWRVGVGVVLLAAAAAPAPAHDGALLRKQRFAGTAHVGEVQLAPVQFEFSCHPASNGSLNIEVVLTKDDAAGGFPLDRFEGPDGFGTENDTAQWSVDTRGAGLNVSGGINGWYGVDGDGFIFGRSQDNRKPDGLGKLVRAVTEPDAKRLRLSVATPDKKGAPFQAELILDGRQAAIREVVAPCLR